MKHERAEAHETYPIVRRNRSTSKCFIEPIQAVEELAGHNRKPPGPPISKHLLELLLGLLLFAPHQGVPRNCNSEALPAGVERDRRCSGGPAEGCPHLRGFCRLSLASSPRLIEVIIPSRVSPAE